MEYMKMGGSLLILIVCVLISVAFVTLMEQKILGSGQVRIGPNYVGYWGLLQPFSDAVKLFTKESMNLKDGNILMYYMAPIFSLTFSLILWLLVPFSEGGLDFMLGVMFFICVSGLGLYPILGSGWSSNCKYSMLGSLRAVSQMVSYEVSLMVILLALVWMTNSFNLSELLMSQNNMMNIIMFFPLGLIWMISSLAETNRNPYDFAEGESELVSGFNTEYSAGGFTLIFMAEYASILFMSFFFCLLFLGGGKLSLILMLKTMVIGFWFVWVRGIMPRYRYDKLMYLAWKSFLPISLSFFVFYLGIGFIV
uniref:NADH dehydrogenase subunit 1 n=1 Tax=Cyphocaris challengeri TaxID=3018532 RepID=UPI0022FDA39A|nr:NADH dehydrogenase subunit 1 [Cyphocaris challengeri]WBQ48844.1 NADH dehydrogenase subunit 1 [Cyphocaris challengeri]